MKKCAVGIDFGTSNIKVSVYDEIRGRAKPLKIDRADMSGDSKTPNVIFYDDREQFVVGLPAIKKRIQRPQAVVDCIKRKLELKRWEHTFPEGGFTLTAEEITEDIFRWIRKAIQEQGREIDRAAITVPVCFTEMQKAKIFCAARNAGIPVAETITEPVAALFSVDELFEDPDEDAEHTVVVFDFGGSTLDLCLCRVACGEGEIQIQVESSSGLHLGGADLTEMLYRDCVYPQNREAIDAEFQLDRLHYLESKLLELTESVKMELFASEEDEAEDYLVLPYSSKEITARLTLEDALRCFAARRVDRQIWDALDALFEDSEFVEKGDVTLVKAFGGSSRVAWFRDLLTKYFQIGDVAYDADEAYTAVADGAARYLNIREQEDSPVIVRNAIPFYVGIEQNGKFRSVVQRNAKYGVFTPSRNLKTILSPEGEWRITLYQSFRRDPGPVDGEDGAVYLGAITLNKALYTSFDRIQYKFGVDHAGRIVGRFYEVDADNEQVLREEIEISIGG